ERESGSMFDEATKELEGLNGESDSLRRDIIWLHLEQDSLPPIEPQEDIRPGERNKLLKQLLREDPDVTKRPPTEQPLDLDEPSTPLDPLRRKPPDQAPQPMRPQPERQEETRPTTPLMVALPDGAD